MSDIRHLIVETVNTLIQSGKKNKDKFQKQNVVKLYYLNKIRNIYYQNIVLLKKTSRPKRSNAALLQPKFASRA